MHNWNHKSNWLSVQVEKDKERPPRMVGMMMRSVHPADGDGVGDRNLASASVDLEVIFLCSQNAEFILGKFAEAALW